MRPTTTLPLPSPTGRPTGAVASLDFLVRNLYSSCRLRRCFGSEETCTLAALPRSGGTARVWNSRQRNNLHTCRGATKSTFRSPTKCPAPSRHMTQFVADLRGLASLCKFGALQDEMIRDHLILHTNCDKIRERLLLENDDLTLAAALHLAVQVESALECAASLSTSSNSLALAKAAGPLESRVPLLHMSADSSEENILLASQSRDRPHQPCGNCGSSAHNSRAQICPARGKTCSNCGKLNHFHKVCRSAPARASQPPTTIIHNVSSGRAPFKTCSLMVGDVTLLLLLDTGATVSLLNLTTYTQFFSREPLGQPTTTLRGYANSKIDIVGSLQLPVKYGDKTLPLFRFNIARHGTNLLGLDLFNSLGFTLLDQAGSEIHTVAIPWQQQWPMLFSGVGCLDVFAHQPLLDPQVTPVIQPLRRSPR